MRKTCDAITSKGEKCRLPAGYQTTHKGVGRCKFHDGKDHVERLVSDIKRDSPFIIIDRNINLINRYIDKMALGQSNIEGNNILRDCINEIAMVEKEDVKVTTTEQGIQIATFNDSSPGKDFVFKEYMELSKSIIKMFEDRVNTILENDRDNKVKFEKQSVTEVHLEPSKPEDDIHLEQSNSKPNKYENIYAMSKPEDDIQLEQSKLKLEQYKDLYVGIFVVLLICGGVLVFGSSGIGPFSIIIYVATLVGFRFFAHIKGNWKFLTPEEREARKIKWEAQKEENKRRWGGPIKSAHIIRLERGLYTGLGNRRPYPHGRRTKKY
jgi:hypothetical protein